MEIGSHKREHYLRGRLLWCPDIQREAQPADQRYNMSEISTVRSTVTFMVVQWPTESAMTVVVSNGMRSSGIGMDGHVGWAQMQVGQKAVAA